jgi:protein TonB
MHAGQSGGYLDARPNRSVALVATVALHAVVIAGLFAFRPQLLEPVITVIPFIKVAPESIKPQPPIETPKAKTVPIKPDTDVRIRPREEASETSATTIATGNTTIEPAQWPEFDRGTKSMPVDPPVEPVFVEAGIDRRYAHDLQPPYPPSMQRLGVEGSVTVRVRIGTDGRVLSVELVRADDPAFFAATRDWAIRKWRFRPATRGGAPVEAVLTKTVRFLITNQG